MNWDDLRVLLAVQRQGGHAAAGRALGVDPTTIGRRLVALEESVGTKLFQRTRNGLVATEEGARLAGHAERMESEVLASERTRGDALAGTVRVTAGDGVISHVLVPALGELFAQHPSLCVEFRGAFHTLDLSRREADIAIRLSRPTERALVGKKLGVARFGLFASEQYLARRGWPATEAALAEHDLIAYDASLDATAYMTWFRARAKKPFRIRSSTTGAMIAACAAGHGIALAITPAFRHHPGIVQVLPGAEIPPREAWAAMHGDLRKHPRVVAICAWASRAFAAAGMS